jgi:GR25 family glycosyltransferase involved in LPS biosynthesis
MTWIAVALITFTILVIMWQRSRIQGTGKYGYKCFLLTLPTSIKRRKKFIKHHDPEVPLEIIYGYDTRIVKNARKYEDLIDSEYFEKAVEMHYDPSIKRPDITYFNVGAIGCFMGHMEFYRRCFKQGIKYAVIFEDNVIIKSHRLYEEIQKVIDQKGDDFEMCFFHCLSRLPDIHNTEKLEKVKWISSTKCYLINVENMKKYTKYFLPMDNHVDMKHEDLIAKGARIYYKDMRQYMKIDRTHNSTIAHSEHGRKHYFSRHNPSATPNDLEWGY